MLQRRLCACGLPARTSDPGVQTSRYLRSCPTALARAHIRVRSVNVENVVAWIRTRFKYVTCRVPRCTRMIRIPVLPLRPGGEKHTRGACYLARTGGDIRYGHCDCRCRIPPVLSTPCCAAVSCACCAGLVDARSRLGGSRYDGEPLFAMGCSFAYADSTGDKLGVYLAASPTSSS